MSLTLATESATVQDPLVAMPVRSDGILCRNLRRSFCGEDETGNYSRSGTTNDEAISESTRSGIKFNVEHSYYTR